MTAPRILGFMDRSPESATYGCAERYYWKYRLHDFPNARFQETALLLAQLYSYDFEENLYFHNPRVFDWALSAATFWLKCRNSDGSCTEVYPFERSFCATSFSTFCMARALGELIHAASVEDGQRILARSELLEALEKSAGWIERNITFEVSNQTAAAACALKSVGLLLGEISWEQKAANFIKELCREYHKKGFFPEYGGFDLGYTTITASCLTWYALRSDDPGDVPSLIEQAALKGASMIDEFGCYNCSEMSRKTQYLYPSGFAYARSPVIDRLLCGLEKNRILSPLWLDDRYCIGMAIDYLTTHRLLSMENIL